VHYASGKRPEVKGGKVFISSSCYERKASTHSSGAAGVPRVRGPVRIKKTAATFKGFFTRSYGGVFLVIGGGEKMGIGAKA